MRVLVTGAAGYIGSAVSVALAEAGHRPVGVDVRPFSPSVGAGHWVDIANQSGMAQLFRQHRIDAVVHCAALVSAEESVAHPVRYWRANVAATLALLQVMPDVRTVFSSSAAVYAPDGRPVVREDAPLGPTSPYGSTKLAAEMALRDTGADVLALRYFNVIGPGERRNGNVMDRLWQARAAGKPFTVNGADWPTRDGTCLRDYVHVRDVARAHVAAVEATNQGFTAVNIGTGYGTTVRELADMFGRKVGPLRVDDGPRREGDVPGSVAGVDLACQLLGWDAELMVDDAIADEAKWRHDAG